MEYYFLEKKVGKEFVARIILFQLLFHGCQADYDLTLETIVMKSDKDKNISQYSNIFL
jgi:hypothetical protein